MSCYKPLKGFPIGRTENGKIDFKITNYTVDHVELWSDGLWHKADSDFVSSRSCRTVSDFVDIPCGKCVGCRLDYSKSWADRCLMELKYHKHSYFLTLTYDDEHLNYVELFNNDGVIYERPTLVKEDFTKFMKRLRFQYSLDHDNKLRFFMCGEYGGKTLRPHYHAIIFGLEIPDLKVYKQSSIGDTYYTSEWLNKVWQKGFVVIGEANEQSCGYVARYTLKKAFNEDESLYNDSDLEREFVNCSRRPGIAAQYFEDNPDILQYDTFALSTPNGGVQVRPPRYFAKLAEKNKDFTLSLKQTKKEQLGFAKTREDNIDTSLSKLERLYSEEEIKKRSIKSLFRNSI